jgi:hypothetical protein
MASLVPSIKRWHDDATWLQAAYDPRAILSSPRGWGGPLPLGSIAPVPLARSAVDSNSNPQEPGPAARRSRERSGRARLLHRAPRTAWGVGYVQ